MEYCGDFGSSMSRHSRIGQQGDIFRPAEFSLAHETVSELGDHQLFDERLITGYTHQLFGEMPAPGIWNVNTVCSTPTAAEAFPLAGVNGAGSGAPQIFDPISTSATHQYEPHGNENYSPFTQSGSLSPIWVPNAINAQSEWCSSSIERHRQQVFDTMATLQGRVLSVRILHAMYPVTLDMLNHVFSLYGSVEKIVPAFPLTGHPVLIQYQQHQMASLALRVLQGHSLYQSCCYLEVKYALGSELQVLCPFLGVGNIFAREGTCKDLDASAMANERVIEQPTPMQVLDEVPLVHDPKVAVQLCNSKVVQAATMVKQGNPASSTLMLMHVDDLQLPTSVQDAPDLLKEMPVYDVYDEDTDAFLHDVIELCETVGQHKQFDSDKHDATKLSSGASDNELLAVCSSKASDNAFSEEATDFTCSHGSIIDPKRSIKLTNEKSTQAASILSIHEAIMHCYDERSELNIKKQDLLINKHNITYSCDLNNDKEVPFALQYQLPLSNAPCIWDPGIDLFSYKQLHLFSWIPHSAILLLQLLHNKNNSSMCEFSLEKGRQVQWDPGIQFILYELWWFSKRAGYVLRHLLAVKFGRNYTYYLSDTSASMCDPPANLIQQRRTIAALLHLWPYKLLSSVVCTWDPGIAFLHQQGVYENYNAKHLLLSSETYLQIWELGIIFITFRPP